MPVFKIALEEAFIMSFRNQLFTTNWFWNVVWKGFGKNDVTMPTVNKKLQAKGKEWNFELHNLHQSVHICMNGTQPADFVVLIV